MAKQNADCITLELFANTPKVGVAKTNALTQERLIRVNKRNQLRRDKSSGLKRIELKLHLELVQKLEAQASKQGTSRAELIEKILQHYFSVQENRK